MPLFAGPPHRHDVAVLQVTEDLEQGIFIQVINSSSGIDEVGPLYDDLQNLLWINWNIMFLSELCDNLQIWVQEYVRWIFEYGKFFAYSAISVQDHCSFDVIF